MRRKKRRKVCLSSAAVDALERIDEPISVFCGRVLFDNDTRASVQLARFTERYGYQKTVMKNSAKIINEVERIYGVDPCTE